MAAATTTATTMVTAAVVVVAVVAMRPTAGVGVGYSGGGWRAGYVMSRWVLRVCVCDRLWDIDTDGAAAAAGSQR